VLSEARRHRRARLPIYPIAWRDQRKVLCTVGLLAVLASRLQSAPSARASLGLPGMAFPPFILQAGDLALSSTSEPVTRLPVMWINPHQDEWFLTAEDHRCSPESSKLTPEFPSLHLALMGVGSGRALFCCGLRARLTQVPLVLCAADFGASHVRFASRGRAAATLSLRPCPSKELHPGNERCLILNMLFA
jgi:hypothetical protein